MTNSIILINVVIPMQTKSNNHLNNNTLVQTVINKSTIINKLLLLQLLIHLNLLFLNNVLYQILYYYY